LGGCKAWVPAQLQTEKEDAALPAARVCWLYRFYTGEEGQPEQYFLPESLWRSLMVKVGMGRGVQKRPEPSWSRYLLRARLATSLREFSIEFCPSQESGGVVIVKLCEPETPREATMGHCRVRRELQCLMDEHLSQVLAKFGLQAELCVPRLDPTLAPPGALLGPRSQQHKPTGSQAQLSRAVSREIACGDLVVLPEYWRSQTELLSDEGYPVSVEDVASRWGDGTGEGACHVFISYGRSKSTNPVADSIHAALQAAGMTAFLDRESIPMGHRWGVQLQAALRTCSVVVCLLDPKFESSTRVGAGCMWELRTAVRSGKVVKPVLLEPRYRVPPGSPLDDCIRGLQYVRWDDAEVMLPRLVQECTEALQHALPRGLPASAAPPAAWPVHGPSCKPLVVGPDAMVGGENEILFSYCSSCLQGEQVGETLMLRIRDALHDRGVVGMHCKMVPGGSNWRQWWCTTATRCGLVVPILSPSFLRSRPCQDELTFAHNHGCILIPVLGEPFRNIPHDLEMMLQNSNRIPDRGRFADRFEANMDQLANDIWYHLEQRPGGRSHRAGEGIHQGVAMGHASAPTQAMCQRAGKDVDGAAKPWPNGGAGATQGQACSFCSLS